MRGIFHQSGNFLHALRIARHNRQGGALQIGFGQAKMENVMKYVVILLILAVAAMASARYL